MGNNKRTTIGNLPTKTEYRRNDVIPIEDKGATFNTPVGRLEDYFRRGMADGITVINNRLYLTNNGEIIDINNGVKINVSDTITFATEDDIRLLFREVK